MIYEQAIPIQNRDFQEIGEMPSPSRRQPTAISTRDRSSITAAASAGAPDAPSYTAGGSISRYFPILYGPHPLKHDANSARTP